MEYLMTYGWAILIIAVVLGALFSLGVFNGANFAPKAPPGACQVFRPNGPGSTSFINLEGVCSGELPEYAFSFPNTTTQGDVVPESQSLDSAWDGGSWTIAAWFKETTVLGPGEARFLIDETAGCVSGLVTGESSATQYSIYTAQWYSSGGLCINDGVVAAGFGGIPYNTWVFIVSTFHYIPPSGGWVAACVDGACDNSSWTANDPTDYAAYGYAFQIQDNNCCGGFLYGGELADVQLYNTSLSASTMNAMYYEGIGGAPIQLQNLVGWWPLNGNGQDYSGNNNNGAVNSGDSFDGSWMSGYATP
jgi:hypothetical protein